ncbi:acyl-CoA dehydrogenase [Blastococcus sp. MG754426]|uniref:acyl-CoA dehydrogenase family protein n=1 Tax=unclassified Blastococcus TaxID=2619396 RepID=UPI001EF14C94|nr:MULTISPECIES: acyl-CoA dehydrogenase family protein [unclassified Blastococcus]MCF6507608.1 acyl-CoA dehydrogenase [Blastococcus sp. MG754426]MCF6512000.1 acyl-CoA dehydrogenase [Blastococcus sp. MG754427]MCF6735205.1 acyl-CoA dehydrogenase [Blastococcus sp. KM273129]
MTADTPDFYAVEDLLEPAEIELRDRVRAFCDAEVTPHINDYWDRADFPLAMAKKLAGLGIVGGTIEGYGCPGMSNVAAGLVAAELARADGSIGTFNGVHSFLAMQSIAVLGDEEQRERWLPEMARLEKIGAFGLTEPAHGSDAVALETSARRDGDAYVLNGQKKWIGNGSIADYVIIWARGEDGAVGGYVVEKGSPGYEATVMTGKTALRAVWQAEITLTDVRVPVENKLANCHSFKDVSQMLDRTRYTVAWRALGLATASYELALAHALRREQFGQPIAGFQLVQDKLARMLAEITAMQLMCWRLSKLADAGRMTAAMASLAKMNHAAKARAIVADARDILGGDGILLDHHVARHHADMEAIFTFEGTDSVQALIVGRAVTGLSAISGRRPEKG